MPSSTPCFQVDAFADRPFTGNPAAVCLLSEPVENDWMQAVAKEMNLSETAFVRRLNHREEGNSGFELRWFTPAFEVELCGHATLAAAHVLWQEQWVADGEPIRFETLSGTLTCRPDNELIELDFPATPACEADPPFGLIEALNAHQVDFVGGSKFDKLVVVSSEEEVRSLRPDFLKLGKIEMRGVIVTSRSDDPAFDFVSRFFAPRAGVNEDPVTGSAHCCLGPYWGGRMNKTTLMGFQASERGGVVQVCLQEDRVRLSGRAITILEGRLLC